MLESIGFSEVVVEEEILKCLGRLFPKLDFQKVDLESISGLASNTTGFFIYHSKLKSVEIKEAILDLYEISYNQVSEAMRISEGYSYTVVTPVQTDLFMSKNAALEGAQPIDYEKVLASDKYKGVLTYWRGLRYFTVEVRNEANLKASNLIELIDEYLTK